MTTILELETERLVIKPLSENDFDKVYKLQSHPEVMCFIGSGQPKSKDQVKQLFDMMLNHQKKHGFCLCPTYEKKSGLLIGFSGLVHLALDDANPDIEVGYWFLPEFWGKGYATEITKAFIQWAFKHLPIDIVVGITHPDHTRSQHVLEKSGLQFIKRSTYRERDVLRFEINRNDTSRNENSYTITEDCIDKELKRKIYEGFSEHAIDAVGSDGNMVDITFVARDRDNLLGAVHGQTFWGALHIKYLYVNPCSRGKGIGRALMNRTFDKGITMGCRFAFVETMSFQAVDFYKSLGFEEDFVRSGYDKGTSFHYLKKHLHVRGDE